MKVLDPFVFQARKRRKLKRLSEILRKDLQHVRTARHYDFLTPELRSRFSIVATDNVSAHAYDGYAQDIISTFSSGLVLDCGAGRRAKYHENVVNFEIVDYDSTDVLGVGEVLPFRDDVFDAVLSLNVLEHVKNPFQCAAEIVRVLKPGGKLYCVVPLLQPVHGYPHHYYNMTAAGVGNLFDGRLVPDRQEVLASGHPVWALCSIISSWAGALQEEDVRQQFLDMKVADLVRDPLELLSHDFVRRLPVEKQFELACTTAYFGRKPESPEPAAPGS